MENIKLNSLVISYKANRSDDIFNEVYNELLGGLHRMNAKIAKSIGISPNEVIALYQDALLRCIDKYNGNGNFRNYFGTSVKRARIDAMRRRSVVIKNEMFYEDLSKSDDESEAATFEIKSDFNLEETVIKKKEAEQLQLIDSLTKDVDATTTAIVKAYMTLPKASPTAIEKATGICRKKVKRKLEKLASKFDPKQFGDYHDYLVAQ